MNPLMFLNPGRWVMYGALVAAVLLGIYTLDKSRQQKGYDKAQNEYTAAALKASEAARATEQVLIAKNQKVANDYQTEKRRRIADAAVSASRLQELNAVIARAGADTSPASGTDDPRGAIINQCAGALVGMDDYAKEVAGKARALQEYTNAMRLNQ